MSRGPVTGRLIAVCLVASTLASGALIAVYSTGGQVQLEGVFVGVALGGLGLALILWAKEFLPVGGEVQLDVPVVAVHPEHEQEQHRHDGEHQPGAVRSIPLRNGTEICEFNLLQGPVGVLHFEHFIVPHRYGAGELNRPNAI